MSVDEYDAMLQAMRMQMERAMGGATPDESSPEARQAQELYYDAMEQGDMELIFDALELDPGNPDCLLEMLHALDPGDPEALKFSKHIVDLAAERLGEDVFEALKGHFWGMIETRPYMRARHEYALRLNEAGKTDEAIEELKNMLELNPNDNQGLRYMLIGLYLRKNRLKEAWHLLETYAEERPYSAIMSWSHVLERFLNGQKKEAETALAAARKQNGYVAAYLQGHRKLPKNSPSRYSPGSREEAQICAEELKPAWDAHPEAVAWLKNAV